MAREKGTSPFQEGEVLGKGITAETLARFKEPKECMMIEPDRTIPPYSIDSSDFGWTVHIIRFFNKIFNAIKEFLHMNKYTLSPKCVMLAQVLCSLSSVYVGRPYWLRDRDKSVPAVMFIIVSCRYQLTVLNDVSNLRLSRFSLRTLYIPIQLADLA
ncbi:hypothetical protein J6590_011495 [Homalodisca vitripennis]|nr:hypothetical protein J6590_011495 [Homalodisca vitripennis]